MIDPYRFRPIAELLVEGKLVELQTARGRIVRGWLFTGHCGVANGRTFWTQGVSGLEKITAVGWREIDKGWASYSEARTH